jgi:hypothetical protein
MKQRRLAGWVARTRPLAEPLSPRGPQPVLSKLQSPIVRLNGSTGPPTAVPGTHQQQYLPASTSLPQKLIGSVRAFIPIANLIKLRGSSVQ